MAREALNSVLKAAHVRRVGVRLVATGDHATSDVADEGVGFEPSFQGDDGFGLQGMRECVERLGGMFGIDSAPGAGTSVHVQVAR